MSDFGGSASPQQIDAQIAARRPSDFIEVSPKFTPGNAQFNQYPTIAEGLARADVLIGGGSSGVDVYVRAGDYEEENLIVNNGVALAGNGYSRIVGLASPTAGVPLVKIKGTGLLRNITIDPQGSNPTGAAVETDSDCTGIAIWGITVGGLAAGYSYGYGIRFKENGGQLVGAGMATVIMISGGTDVILVEGNVNAYMFNAFLTGLFIGGQVIQLKTGTLVSPTITMNTNNCSVLGTGVTYIDLEANTKIDLNGTPVSDSMIVSADGPSAINLTEAESMQQSAYPDAGSTWGSVQSALNSIKVTNTDQEKSIDDLKDNVAIIATTIDIAEDQVIGDLQGLFEEPFIDEDNILSGSSYNYYLEKGRLFSGAIVTNDDFESYASSAALQAVWVGQDTVLPTLSLTGGVGASQAMLLTISNPSHALNRFRKTLSADLYSLSKIRFSLTGTGGCAAMGIRVRVQDGNSNNAVSIWARPTDGQSITEYDFDITNGDFTKDPGFDANSIAWIEFQVGAYGSNCTFIIDDLKIITAHKFTQTGLIDNLDAINPGVLWTGTGITISQGTTGNKEGTGHMVAALNGGSSSSRTIHRTWAGGGTYAPILLSDPMIHCWFKCSNITTPGQINEMFLNLRDESGNEVQLRSGKTTLALPNFIESTQLTWIAKAFYIGNATLITGTTFDFTKVVRMEFKINGNTIVGDLHIDIIQAGYACRIVSERISTGAFDSWDEMKLHGSYFASPDETCFRCSLTSAPGNPPNFYWTQTLSPDPNTALGIYCYEGQSNKRLGDWIEVHDSGGLYQFVYAIDALEIKMGGIAVLWR